MAHSPPGAPANGGGTHRGQDLYKEAGRATAGRVEDHGGLSFPIHLWQRFKCLCDLNRGRAVISTEAFIFNIVQALYRSYLLPKTLSNIYLTSWDQGRCLLTNLHIFVFFLLISFGLFVFQQKGALPSGGFLQDGERLAAWIPRHPPPPGSPPWAPPPVAGGRRGGVGGTAPLCCTPTSCPRVHTYWEDWLLLRERDGSVMYGSAGLQTMKSQLASCPLSLGIHGVQGPQRPPAVWETPPNSPWWGHKTKESGYPEPSSGTHAPPG